jgi:SAM-dependent methyltransferase
MRTIGLEYGAAFQALNNISYGGDGQALATCLPLPMEVAGTRSSEFTVYPTRLDGVFQLGFAAIAGGKEFLAMVPTRIRRLRVQASGFGHRNGNRETAHCRASPATERNTYFSISIFDENTLELKARVEDLELTALSGTSEERKSMDEAPGICQHVVWKPGLATMSADEVITFCRSIQLGPADLKWVRELHSLMLSSAILALKSIRSHESSSKKSSIAPSMKKHALWLNDWVGSHVSTDLEELGYLSNHLPSTPVIDAYVTISKNLQGTLSGDVCVNDLLPQEWGVLEVLRQLDLDLGAAKDPLATYINCLTHKHPNLRFCDIGARFGTVAEVLPNFHGDAITPRRCAAYTVTDADESVLSRVRQQLSGKPHVDFKVMDRSQELAAQGFEPYSLDVVILNMADHGSTYQNGSIKSISELLKPSGRLFVREPPQESFLWSFIRGLVPNIAWPETDAPQDAGSFQSSLALQQSQTTDTIPRWSLTLHQKSSTSNGETSSESPIHIVNPDSLLQQAIGKELCKTKICDPSCLLSLSDAAVLPDKTCQDFVLLADLETPLLSDICESDFTAIKTVLQNARSVTRVKSADDVPDYALNEGLLRVCRHEYERSTFQSLGVEIKDRDHARIAHLIGVVLKNTQQVRSSTLDAYEPEHRQGSGLLHIPRVVEARVYDKQVFASIEKPLTRQEIGDKALRLAFATLDVLDTLEFVNDNLAQTPLAFDQVEIKVQAVRVNFKDLMGLLGRAPTKELGSEFAGIVIALGKSVNNVRPGDRVVAAYVDSYRTYARAPWQSVHRIPDGVSFGSAASVPTAFRTAYFCLFHLARLQKNDSILIHRASGATGQAAVQLAKLIGATIYVTVGFEAKKQLLMEQYGIPEQHILYSGDSSFGVAIQRLTNNRGVDVLLNSLSGELLNTSWDIIAPCGSSSK